MGEKIREGIQAGLDSKKIATILRDAPIDFEIQSLERKEDNYEKLSAFYRQYDMYSLLKKIDMNKVVESDFKVEVVKKMPKLTNEFSLHVGVYDTNYHKSAVLGYSVYTGSKAYYIDLMDALEDDEFKAVLKDESINKYGYNVKKEMIASLWNGIEIKGYSFDLQLVMLSIFLCALWPCVRLLWRNVYLDFLPHSFIGFIFYIELCELFVYFRD